MLLNRKKLVTLLPLAGTLLAAFSPFAEAYVGPGVGLSAIGSIVALLSAILLGIVGFVWYPVKKLWRRLSK